MHVSLYLLPYSIHHSVDSYMALWDPKHGFSFHTDQLCICLDKIHTFREKQLGDRFGVRQTWAGILTPPLGKAANQVNYSRTLSLSFLVCKIQRSPVSQPLLWGRYRLQHVRDVCKGLSGAGRGAGRYWRPSCLQSEVRAGHRGRQHTVMQHSVSTQRLLLVSTWLSTL